MLSQLLEKTESEVANIWSKLVFSGNAKSLPRVADEKAMLARVAGDPNAIGYVDSKSVNSSVKVLAAIHFPAHPYQGPS
jgi:ABC-type phosphate transport system substrate-binding protein